jgi:hypothetical protein
MPVFTKQRNSIEHVSQGKHVIGVSSMCNSTILCGKLGRLVKFGHCRMVREVRVSGKGGKDERGSFLIVRDVIVTILLKRLQHIHNFVRVRK